MRITLRACFVFTMHGLSYFIRGKECERLNFISAMAEVLDN